MIEKHSNNSKGGARPGAGRKPGKPSRKSVEQAAKAAEGGIMPLDYLLQVMRAPESEPREKLVAAQAAAPYIHAKLSSVNVTGDMNHTHRGFVELPMKRG